MKLVSDFDGIWTDQDGEAEVVRKYIFKKLVSISGFSADEIESYWKECRKEMDKAPHEFCWFNNGKISAYYGEDPFGDNYAVFNFIDRAANQNSFSVFRQKLFVIKSGILKSGCSSVDEFSNKCFIEATKLYKESGKLAPHPNAKQTLERVLRKGVNVVVTSNSFTEKIEYLFRKIGQRLTNERSFKPGNIHALGNAMKFAITKEPKEIDEILKTSGKFDVQLRRKSYYDLLADEMPDYVIGDVFSLDIALPLYLRLKDERFAKLKVIQKVQPHTPEWVKKFLSKKEFSDFAFMIEDISELPDVIKW